MIYVDLPEEEIAQEAMMVLLELRSGGAIDAVVGLCPDGQIISALNETELGSAMGFTLFNRDTPSVRRLDDAARFLPCDYEDFVQMEDDC